ncbi:DUF2750 domain-containing protein [Alteromonas ponticola]|uniref:DUF2750 domain-containing protein n=1 Tax=Alteromonas aquimaris TaxID=2998417 RepID=A0ABT3P7M2_9ALTE|nr:DUF2750 domain-containing protein [Alteromonas aquimaris]MCW8108759.1 DUF2750 domain-containing protein [Alteromonas aquimaris]
MFPNTITESLPDAIIKQAAALSAEERLELFLQYVDKAGEVWVLLGENGYVMMETLEGHCLPVWPHQQLVSCWHQSQKSEASAKSIGIEEFLQTWLPGLDKNNTTLAIFPAAENEAAIIVTAEAFKLSLSETG